MKITTNKKPTKKVVINITTKNSNSKKNTVLSNVSPFDTIPTVNTLNGLLPYTVVKTLNHDLIKGNPVNRVDPKRTAKFEKLIREGGFFHKPTIVMIDYITHMLNDNHHKVQALKNRGLPITFMLADLGDEFRGDKSIVSIAKLNDSNSAWNSIDKFDKSLKLGYVVANILSGYKSKLDMKIPKNKFKAWNILNFALGKNCESKVLLEDYFNDDFAKILTKKKFKRDFDALIKIIDTLILIRGGGIRISETLKRLSVLNGNSEFDLTEFARKFSICNSYYYPENKNKKSVDDAIVLIYKKRV